MLEFQKSAKLDFFCIIFPQDFWNLKITENICYCALMTPQCFKKISYIIRKRWGKNICDFDISADHTK